MDTEAALPGHGPGGWCLRRTAFILVVEKQDDTGSRLACTAWRDPDCLRHMTAWKRRAAGNRPGRSLRLPPCSALYRRLNAAPPEISGTNQLLPYGTFRDSTGSGGIGNATPGHRAIHKPLPGFQRFANARRKRTPPGHAVSGSHTPRTAADRCGPDHAVEAGHVKAAFRYTAVLLSAAGSASRDGSTAGCWREAAGCGRGHGPRPSRPP